MKPYSFYALTLGTVLAASCGTQPKLARVRIAQPGQTLSAQSDTTSTVTTSGHRARVVSYRERDRQTGERIKLVELDAVTVTAKSKQVAERNGKVNLDFIVTVPAELIGDKWQVQLTPVARKRNDSILLDKLFLSGADFAKMQKKGWLRYQAFINSIVPDSAYLTEMFNRKGYKRALADLEEEYYQAWKNEVIEKEKWIDWSDRINKRFALFNYLMEENKRSIQGLNSILAYLPAYHMYRNLDSLHVPGKWRIFLDSSHRIRTRSITPEDSAEIVRKFMDFKRIAENQKKKERIGEIYDKYVRFPYESSRLDTVIRDGNNFVYYYRQELPVTDSTRSVTLNLNGEILHKDETRTGLPPSDTLTYYISSMVQFLDHTPRYRKKIVTRKDEVNLTAYINYPSAGVTFDDKRGDNAAEIEKVFSTVSKINETGEFLIDSISMTATSSPEGSARANYEYSRQRALNLKRYLASRSGDRKGIDTLFRPRWEGEGWNKLEQLIRDEHRHIWYKQQILSTIRDVKDPDRREAEMKRWSEKDYRFIRETLYPLLRAVEFRFYLHRPDMVQDTVVTDVVDTLYLAAVKMIENREYRAALGILETEGYEEDYNTAVCLMSLGYDSRALDILEKQPDTADRNYLLAILYARLRREEEAVESFLLSCRQDPAKAWRGSLDPEINRLIVKHGLRKQLKTE